MVIGTLFAFYIKIFPWMNRSPLFLFIISEWFCEEKIGKEITGRQYVSKKLYFWTLSFKDYYIFIFIISIIIVINSDVIIFLFFYSCFLFFVFLCHHYHYHYCYCHFLNIKYFVGIEVHLFEVLSYKCPLPHILICRSRHKKN